MKFVIEGKVFNTETSEEVIVYYKNHQTGILFGFNIPMYSKLRTTLYKTKKGNWFSVSENSSKNKFEAYIETEESAKDLLQQLNEIETYNKYFDELEEA